MSMTIVQELRFEAAHHLPRTPEGHKCRRLHGHSWLCEIHVTGEVDPMTGWVQDFATIRDAFRPLYETLDHRLLNEVAGLENPTSENVAVWIWDRLAPMLKGLSMIAIHETCTSRCIYTGA